MDERRFTTIRVETDVRKSLDDLQGKYGTHNVGDCVRLLVEKTRRDVVALKATMAMEKLTSWTRELLRESQISVSKAQNHQQGEFRQKIVELLTDYYGEFQGMNAVLERFIRDLNRMVEGRLPEDEHTAVVPAKEPTTHPADHDKKGARR